MTPPEIALAAKDKAVTWSGESGDLRELYRLVYWLAVCQQEITKELAKRYVDQADIGSSELG